MGVSTPNGCGLHKLALAWLSVTVKRGATIVEIGWDNVFGELLTAVDPDLHVRRVSISKNEPVSMYQYLEELVHLPVSSCMHVLV